MSNMLTDGVILAKVMRDALNEFPDKLSNFELEAFNNKVPCLMIQQLAGAEKEKTFINGSYIGAWHFAIWVRVNGKDTKARLTAIGQLEAIADWLNTVDQNGNHVNYPHIDDERKITKIELQTTPSFAESFADKTEDYQAVFQLEYKFTRRIY